MSWNKRYASEHPNSEYIINQLLEDYPKNSFGWIRDAQWSHPMSIPLENIDYSNEKTWRAFHEPEKVKKFEKKIKKNKFMPVILVQTPKNKKLIVIDGHHRALAFENLNRPVVAWVGKVDKEVGPWDAFHDKQNRVEAVDKQ